jgi:hypothetical protein
MGGGAQFAMNVTAAILVFLVPPLLWLNLLLLWRLFCQRYSQRGAAHRVQCTNSQRNIPLVLTNGIEAAAIKGSNNRYTSTLMVETDRNTINYGVLQSVLCNGGGNLQKIMCTIDDGDCLFFRVC